MRPTSRFPSSRFPEGWFQVGWSHDTAPGEAKALKYFGEDLVLWRGNSGEVFVQDAFCLHIGHNRGIRGTVDGDDIVCAWHGWKWDGEGHNTDIPYSAHPCKRNLKIQTYPVRECWGAILVWYSPTCAPPSWEPPVVPEYENPDYYPMHPVSDRVFRIRAHPQMCMENAVDPAHSVWVHHATSIPQIEFSCTGHQGRADVSIEYGKGKDSSRLTPDGVRHARVTLDAYGMGIAIPRWGDDLLPTVQITCFTPVDDEYMDYFFQQCSKRTPGSTTAEPEGAAKDMLDLQWGVAEQDFFTWENMKFLTSPSFAVEEAKNWAAFRRWASQFYPADDAVRMCDGVVEESVSVELS